MTHRESPGSLERGLLGGLAGFRWLALAWMAVALVATRHELRRPAVAVTLLGAALGATVVSTVLVREHWRWLLRPAVVCGEIAVGWSLLAADAWVYHRSRTVSFGSAWPVAGALAAGMAGGPLWGAAAGAVLGTGRWAGAAVAPGAASPAILSTVSTVVLYAVAGGAAGLVVRRLQAAEAEISAVRAREEVARTLHDGVLQTLAVVQRRSGDPDLATLAREQELELRDYLFGSSRDGGSDDLLASLRHVATRFERTHHTHAEVSCTGTVPSLDPAVVAAFSGAAAEALTNAAKHGAASRVVVFVDVDDGELFCSVKDDGNGFDPSATPEGVGLTRSVRGRLSEIGGTVEVRSRPGSGAEVRLRLPR